ncbi:MAG: gliding motility protein GldN [Bacteroidales bacterium]|jgi:gliding motility associated protien GldN|nr:gliding motility protein GldN [Bacteroidales bacterium]
MKRVTLFLFVITTLFGANLFAQVLDEPQEGPRDSFYEKVSFRQRKAFSFPYVREADVVYQWKIWRVIDFREKLNQVFYYPVVPDQGRVNLYYALEQAINEGKIKIYEDDEFKKEISSWEEKKNSLSRKQTTSRYLPDMDGTEVQVDTTIIIPIAPDDIKSLRIKEDWFIDKQRTVQDVRIAGFSLIYYQIKEEDSAPIPIPLFWVRFDDPEVRELLANTEVYNPKNDAQRRSYDDIFVKRMFSSYIIRESNVYSRLISQYTTGDEALFEAENVKNKIFEIEDDMWEY